MESEEDEATLALRESRSIPACVRVNLFLDDVHATELFAGFLYGQPIWDRSSQKDADGDYKALYKIYNEYELVSTDARDASIDAIRDLIVKNGSTHDVLFGYLDAQKDPDDSELAHLLLDFAVYCNCGGNAMVWAEYAATELF